MTKDPIVTAKIIHSLFLSTSLCRANHHAHKNYSGASEHQRSNQSHWRRCEDRLGPSVLGHQGRHRPVSPTTEDLNQVDYTGWFTNGEKFDSTVDANQPYSFTIGER